MDWWPFGKEQVRLDAPHTLLDDIEKRGKQYLTDVDNGKFIHPACKRAASDVAGDEASVRDHTAFEAFRYLLMVPRNEYRLLAEPEHQVALLDGYLRQLPHDQTVIEFTGVTQADLAIAIIAGFNWLVQCAVLAGADPKQFYGALRHFRGIASPAQRWWATDGAEARYAEMLQAGEQPPLFFNLVWAEYSRMAREIATARAA